jgi:DNA polymerase elongation subunit (family B)
MATLIFDIETVGESWDSFDTVTQKSLTAWVRNNANLESDHEHEIEKIKSQLGFSPLTGRIISIGMFDVERMLGAVYFSGDGTKGTFVDGDYTFKERTEKEMLEDFWEGALSYDVFVTFNGRSFDVPFLLHRSVALGVRPSVELLKNRYLTKQSLPYHVDLLDELTFYGAMSRRSLHLFCRAYGIESPKGLVDGDYVAELFLRKKFRDLARYNAQDVTATTALYEKWKQYLAPASF